jgi:hypothetical protein
MPDGSNISFSRVMPSESSEGPIDIYVGDLPGSPTNLTMAGLTDVETVASNEGLFTKREVAQAIAAKQLWTNLNAPGTQTFLKMLRSGAIADTRVTEADAIRALRIYGRPLRSIRGKTQNSKVRPVRPEPMTRTVDKQQVLYIDLMFVDGLVFLIAVGFPLLMIMVNFLTGRSAAVVYEGIRRVRAAYIGAGFEISDIVCDGEGAVAALTVELNEKGMGVHAAGSGTHVAEVET